MPTLVEVIAETIWNRHFVPEGFLSWHEATKDNPWQCEIDSPDDGFNVKTPGYIKGRVLYCQETARAVLAALAVINGN